MVNVFPLFACTLFFTRESPTQCGNSATRGLRAHSRLAIYGRGMKALFISCSAIFTCSVLHRCALDSLHNLIHHVDFNGFCMNCYSLMYVAMNHGAIIFSFMATCTGFYTPHSNVQVAFHMRLSLCVCMYQAIATGGESEMSRFVHLSSAGVTRPGRPGLDVEAEPPAVRIRHVPLC